MAAAANDCRLIVQHGSDIVTWMKERGDCLCGLRSMVGRPGVRYGSKCRARAPFGVQKAELPSLLSGLRPILPPLPAARAPVLPGAHASTSAAFLSKLHALAAVLCSRVGLGVTSCSCSRPRASVLYSTLMSVGAVVAPTNPSLTAAEVSCLLALSNP